MMKWYIFYITLSLRWLVVGPKVLMEGWGVHPEGVTEGVTPRFLIFQKSSETLKTA
jgi:hypothetical protein